MERGFDESELQAHIPRLRRYARALTGNREAADDLTQDTLERAWLKRGLWRAEVDGGPGSLRAWLFAVMHNVYINGLRRARPPGAIVSLDDDSADTHVPEPAAMNASAETDASLRDLQRALTELPEEQREVLLLVGLEQLSYAEAAQALEVPIGTVMSRLSRGRDRLRELMMTPPRARPLRRVK